MIINYNVPFKSKNLVKMIFPKYVLEKRKLASDGREAKILICSCGNSHNQELPLV